MRTLLLNPPGTGGRRFIREGRCMQSVSSWATAWPPLSLAGLASLARAYGRVELVDACADPSGSPAQVIERARRFAPDLVVLSTAFPSVEGDAEIAAELADALPEAAIVGFGVLFTLLGEEAMQLAPGFDFGLVGEPEATFRAFLDRRSRGESAAGLPGLLWREGDRICRGPRRAPVDDLDALPLPARDLLVADHYRLPHSGKPFTLVQSARGCPYPCSFCVAPLYSGRRLRRRSVESVVAELEVCHQQQGLTAFLFWEEAFTLDRSWTLELCERLSSLEWQADWAATTRVDRVDDALLSAMRSAGCFLLGLGIESASEEVLARSGKGVEVEQARQAVAACRRAGIQTMGHFVFGLPGETPETIEATIDFALTVGLDYLQCYAAVPYPGTALGEQARRDGWLRSSDWGDFDFGGRSILDIGSVSPEEVDRARETLYRRFFLRPGYLLRKGGSLLRRPRQLRQAASFLGWMKAGGVRG